MISKEQERQAIGKIRKIIEGLGENSYVGTAMEGVLELAEDNIRDDAAYSMKQRAEGAERQVEELKEKNEEQAKVLEHMSEIVRRHNEEKKELRERVGKAERLAEKRKLPQNTYKKLIEIVKEIAREAEIQTIHRADELEQCVGEEVISVEIKNMAEEYRRKRDDMKEYNQILRSLEQYGKELAR